MKNILLLAFISIALYAQNPKVYSSLGDVIYDNLDKIESLKKIDNYKTFSFKIDQYSKDVDKTKKLGFAIESGEMVKTKLEYLDKLRELSNINDYFFRSAYISFEKSIDNQDNNLFIDIVNTGMIDTKKNKVKILNYYNLHSEDINSSGLIQNMIDEEKTKKTKKKSYYKTKKQIDEAKIRRIRASDKYKREMMEQKLQKELELKKEKIRKDQERELFN